MRQSDFQWLQSQIVEFMSVIHDCLNSTTYANDRPIYMRDLAVAAGWLVALRKQIAPLAVAREIVSPQTDKGFGDYWRQGDWGNEEARALKLLQDAVRARFALQ